MNSRQLIEVTGIGPGQLQRWSEAGIIGHPVGGKGYRRRFTLRDAIRAGITRNLTRRRVSVATAGKVARSLTRYAGIYMLNPDAFAVVHGDHPQHAAKSPRFEVRHRSPQSQDPTAVITLTPAITMAEIRKAPGPIHLIALGGIVQRISARYHRQTKAISR
jgi:hypothetical protein